ISAAFLPHVFDKFRQADGSFTRLYRGLGLGLAITRHLVELHGGTIEATSEGKDKGSTFRVRLPIARGCGRRPRLAANRQPAPGENASPESGCQQPSSNQQPASERPTDGD